MTIIPPNEIIEYISFENENVIANEDMPQDLKGLFEKFKSDYEAAKQYEKRKYDIISEMFNETS